MLDHTSVITRVSVPELNQSTLTFTDDISLLDPKESHKEIRVSVSIFVTSLTGSQEL